MKILDVAQELFYGEFISLATIKCTIVLMVSARYVCPIVTKFGYLY
jgi:hypothetical protein